MITYPRKLLEPLLRHLRREEKELKKRQEEIVSEDPYENGDAVDNLSDFAESGVEFGHMRSKAMGEETKAALSRVQKAMGRIEDGTFGVCVKCKGMIDTDRLGIDPTVELCIDCAKSEG